MNGPSASPLTVILYALLPAAAAVGAAAAATVFPPGAQLRSMIQHLAAGVVFAVVAGELLPELRQLHAVAEVALGFKPGALAMLGIRAGARRLRLSDRFLASLRALNFITQRCLTPFHSCRRAVSTAAPSLRTGVLAGRAYDVTMLESRARPAW